MDEQKNTPPDFGTLMEKIFTMPWLLLESLVLLFGGMDLGLLIYWSEDIFPALAESDLWTTCESYALCWGVWALVLLVIAAFPKNRPILGAFESKLRGNTWKYFGIGLAIGFGMNALCAAAALMNGDIHIYFDSFSPAAFVLMFIAVFIQSSSEEALCRIFVYQRLRRVYRSPVVAIIGNSVIFAMYHLLNPGVSATAIANILLCGVLLSLIVYYFESFWCAAAIHTAWNFTQNTILGLPNSGIVMPYSVFKLDAGSASKSFAYDPAFGIEGTVLSCLVLACVAVCVFICGRRCNARLKDIWGEQAAPDYRD